MDKKLATKITIGTILVVNIALAVTANVKSRREFKKLVEACAEISK